jgi:hypothetical protein
MFPSSTAGPAVFSECFVPDTSKTICIVNALKRTTITPVTNALLSGSGTVFRFLCIYRGKMTVITRPFPATDSDLSSVILAIRGDAMDAICPVQMPTKYFHGQFVSLIRAATAAEFHWLVSDDDPRLQMNPA